MRDSRVVALAQAAVGNAGSIAAAAAAIGISRPYLSRYLNDDLDGVDSIEDAIKKHYDRRACPHTGTEVTPDVCHRKALTPEPFGGSARNAQWTTCQTCPHKPVKEKLQ
jgi:hypothetical protein